MKKRSAITSSFFVFFLLLAFQNVAPNIVFGNMDYKEEDEIFQEFIQIRKESKRHVFYIVKSVAHRYLKYTGIELNPYQQFSFIGPPGAFIVSLLPKGRTTCFFPMKLDIQKDGKISYWYDSVGRRSRLYLGYYFPEKNTGKPRAPDNDDYAAIYVYKPGAFKEEEEVDEEKMKEEITPFPQRVDINRLTPLSPLRKGLFYLAIPLYFFILLSIYSLGKERREDRLKDAQHPRAFRSMRSLFESDRKRKFLCLHCGEPLKIKGRFECRVGHVPRRDRYIFKNCPKCDDVHEYIVCAKCGRDMSLDEKIYNEEEIKNRGKKYIARKNPCKQDNFFYFIIPFMFIFIYVGLLKTFLLEENTILPLSIIYLDFYGLLDHVKLFDPLTPVIFFLVIIAFFVLGILFIKTRKDIVIRNPYETEI
jgi:hypothetical protein